MTQKKILGTAESLRIARGSALEVLARLNGLSLEEMGKYEIRETDSRADVLLYGDMPILEHGVIFKNSNPISPFCTFPIEDMRGEVIKG